jgi:4-hydroxybenzoate polyprenyltransferase
LLGLYVAGLSYVARSENSLSVTNVGLVALLFLPVVYSAARLNAAPPALFGTLPLLLVFTVWVAYSVSFVYRARDRQIGRAVGHLIAGIALCDGLVLAAVGSVSGVALALAAFGLTLLLQRYVKGT